MGPHCKEDDDEREQPLERERERDTERGREHEHEHNRGIKQEIGLPAGAPWKLLVHRWMALGTH